MFFPLMKVTGLTGFLDLFFLPPNNWENRFKKPIVLNLIWSSDSHWSCMEIGSLEFGESKRITTTDFPDVFQNNTLAFIYPSIKELPRYFELLPTKAFWHSEIPQWRNTSGFYNNHAQVSYQSEVFPLPENGTLLSFHPFIQYGNVTNKLVFLNLQKKPHKYFEKIYIYDSLTKKKIGSSEVQSNSVTEIDLDQFMIEPNCLPVIFSKGMAGIPFGLGESKDKCMLSLEHTHPPASFVLFGNRFGVQSQIKKRWFERLNEN